MESKIRIARNKVNAELEKQFLAESKATFRN